MRVTNSPSTGVAQRSDRADDAQPSHSAGPAPLKRLVGPFTIVCVGVGGAIGSGIFATPGEAALYIRSPWIILALWVVAGFATFLQSLVMAELATRLPRAGGEYQFLKEAYGDFAGFFFGWAFTIFVVGAGGGTIAAAFGEFAASLFALEGRTPQIALGCGAVASVVILNALGLRAGAVTQNVLTALKVLALLAMAVGAMVVAGRVTPILSVVEPEAAAPLTLQWLLVAYLPVFWPYTGATDSAKLAEELRDVQRTMPRALLASAAALTGIYVFFNYALFCALTTSEMAGARSAPALVFAGANLPRLRELILAVSAMICLGSISSVFLANIRVTYALARDGLTFRFLGRMSRAQAPVASLVVGGLLCCVFIANRSFGEILRIYFLGSAALFAMSYASLLVFRRRDRRAGRGFPVGVFRVPVAGAIVALLIILEAGIAWSIIHADYTAGRPDSLWTLALLAALAILYGVWRKFAPAGSPK